MTTSGTSIDIVFSQRLQQCRYLIPFDSQRLPQVFTDILVIGGGVAGASAAMSVVEHAPQADVVIVTKNGLTTSNTAWAQGGVATVLDAQDSFDNHIQDTLTAGAGLCDVPVTGEIIAQAPQELNRLRQWGMQLDTDETGTLRLGREGGHGHKRIVHSDGDATGKEMARAHQHILRQQENVRIFENCFVIDILTDAQNTCRGVLTHHPRYGLQVIWARSVIMASGGAGHVWRETTNPDTATGDSVAMAWRAGANVSDMAFVQFHPTTLYLAGASRSLITEAVRGEGGQLVDRYGHRFMFDYDARGELAPRDIVSQAIETQIIKTDYSHVYLDVRPIGIEAFKTRFPGISALLDVYDIDPAEGRIPVHPSCHYQVGGVAVDHKGHTSVKGLWACGEAACSGFNGANRLASNSLLEGMVMGRMCGAQASTYFTTHGAAQPTRIVHDGIKPDRIGLDIADIQRSVRSLMWRHVGITRDGNHLKEVHDLLKDWSRYTLGRAFDTPAAWQLQNILTYASLVTASALWRQESRGTHSRRDFPQVEDDYCVHDIWQRGQEEPSACAVKQ